MIIGGLLWYCREEPKGCVAFVVEARTSRTRVKVTRVITEEELASYDWCMLLEGYTESLKKTFKDELYRLACEGEI